MAHYLEALDWQSGATLIHVLFGGRNPHPNMVVGGVPLPVDMAGEEALNRARLDLVRANLGHLQAFVEQVYWPDMLAIMGYYKDNSNQSKTVNYIGRKEYQRVSLSEQMVAPYRRIMVMHLAIILCAFLLNLLGANQITLILLILLKVAIDASAHWREHRRLGTYVSDGVSGDA